MGGDDARDEIGIVALQRRPAEADGRLRHVERDRRRSSPRPGKRGVRDGLQIPSPAGRRRPGRRARPRRSRRSRRPRRSSIYRGRAPAWPRDEIGPLDARQGLEGAFGRLAVGVAAKGLRPPVAAATVPGSLASWRRRALACSRTRTNGSSSKRGALTARRRSSAARSRFLPACACARPMIAVAVELHFDRLLVERPLEGLRVEVARAFVERPASSIPRPAFSAGSCAAPPRMANSSETSGTAGDATNQKVRPRGLSTTSHIDGGMGGREGEVFLHGRFHEVVLLGRVGLARGGG